METGKIVNVDLYCIIVWNAKDKVKYFATDSKIYIQSLLYSLFYR